MPFDFQRARPLLQSGNLTKLFVEELGWEPCRQKLTLRAGESDYAFAAIAEKRGFTAWLCSSADGRLPDPGNGQAPGGPLADPFGITANDFGQQKPARRRMKLELLPGFFAPLLRPGTQEALEFMFRFGRHHGLDGNGSVFLPEKMRPAMIPSRSRHLLKRELTVFGFNSRASAISS